MPGPGASPLADALEESALRDSEPPRWTGVVHLLLTAFDEPFPSHDAATEAIRQAALGAGTRWVCADAHRFTASTTTVHAGEPP
jgi:hypothetical protein